MPHKDSEDSEKPGNNDLWQTVTHNRRKPNEKEVVPQAPRTTVKENWRQGVGRAQRAVTVRDVLPPTSFQREPVKHTGVLQTVHEYISTHNWRIGNNPKQKQKYERVRKAHTAEQLEAGKHVYATGPRTINGVPYNEQVPGAITWHFDIRDCTKSCRSQTHEHITGQNGKVMSKKGRYWVIVRADFEKIYEVPVYTNCNAGLVRTPERLHKEYCSLKPTHVSSKAFVNQSRHNEVLNVGSIRDYTHGETQLSRETMVVHLTEVFSRDVDVDDLRIVGSLIPASERMLCRLVDRARRM